ncbi:MAG TPA: lipopolysaccharide assembly protein LapA domain-containing protein [Syntrophomonadaceae bacterium]|nr:lipopolysaccharide assembly protein LapA domain-containing protein [Syntrophomonadaceae bacterium]HQE22657.1 lipopolysaccharide assembly protein LapA domain-containing protein [Syntrophomonadaceae bacterium]
MAAYLIGALIFAAGVAVFVMQNTALVSVRFVNWVSPEVSVAVVALAAALLGALIAFMLDSIRYYKVAKKMKDLMNANRRLEKELMKLRKNETVAEEAPKTTPLAMLSGKMRKELQRLEGKSKPLEQSPSSEEQEQLNESPVQTTE